MDSVARSAGLIYLGRDTSKDKIAVGILRADAASPDVEMIFNDEASIRRLINRFPDPGQLRACYEAGPVGFELHRLLTSMGVACQVIAPSLIPTAPGDRVKTDRRDCKRLARLHRAGELVAIRVPTRPDPVMTEQELAQPVPGTGAVIDQIRPGAVRRGGVDEHIRALPVHAGGP